MFNSLGCPISWTKFNVLFVCITHRRCSKLLRLWPESTPLSREEALSLLLDTEILRQRILHFQREKTVVRTCKIIIYSFCFLLSSWFHFVWIKLFCTLLQLTAPNFYLSFLTHLWYYLLIMIPKYLKKVKSGHRSKFSNLSNNGKKKRWKYQGLSHIYQGLISYYTSYKYLKKKLVTFWLPMQILNFKLASLGAWSSNCSLCQ